MKFTDFIRDKLAYAVVYFASTVLVILVIYLTLIVKGIELSQSNLFYAVLLSIVLFSIFILYDYYRKKTFYKQLKVLLNLKGDLDYILNIGEPSSREQEIFKNILLNTYKVCGDKLVKYEEAHKQYIYFINQWVHQMKTPVSVINLILQDQIEEGKSEVFDSILEENEKLAHGLDIMLYNARLNEFNLDFNVESLNVISIVRKVINNNKKSLIRYHIFPKIIGDIEVFVESDKKWIYFVINQILINAIKYSKDMAEDRKTIAFEILEEVNKVILTIRDEGIGIPKEDLSRVFNAFFTGKNGRKSAESTGMGMYLSKRICKELGHELSVKSEEGKGTSFSIVFYKGRNLFKL